MDSPDLPADFDRFTAMRGESAGMYEYENKEGNVYGVINVSEISPGRWAAGIYEWTSAQPGLGHADQSLRWLRERFSHVSAHGIGEIDEDGVGDISTVYWQRQQAKGLVDQIFLDDGAELKPVAPPQPRKRGP